MSANASAWMHWLVHSEAWIAQRRGKATQPNGPADGEKDQDDCLEERAANESGN
jgi:hypothetical protein